MTAGWDPIRTWREEYGRQMLNLDFQPLSDDPFYADFRSMFDGMPIVRSWFSPGLTTRDDELVRDGDDAVTLLISNTKGIEASQLGRSVQLGAGEATLLSVESPGYVGTNRHFTFDAMMIPRVEFLDRVPHALDSAVERIQRGSEPLRMLRAYLRALEKQPVTSASLREAVRRHVIDLASLAVSLNSGIGESNLESVTATRTAIALEHIRANFHEPRLNLGSVAVTLGVSPRYLQKLFERAGTSFIAELNAARLDHAYNLLRHGPDLRISDVAFQSGFSDVSHFNRMFRARFGDTPSGVRAGPHT